MNEELKRCIRIVKKRIDLLYKLLRTDENGQQVDDNFIKGAICEAIQISKELKENNSPQKCNLAGESIEKVATSKNSPPGDTHSTKQELNKEISKDYPMTMMYGNDFKKKCVKSVLNEEVKK